MSKIAQDLADKALAARSVGGVVKAGEYPEWAAGLKEIAEQHYAKNGINKQAAGVMDNIGSYLAANPTLRNSLIGLGGGAGLGALAGLTSGALSDDEDSSTLSKMLNYGLLGGGLGAAGGAAYGLLSKPNELPKVNKAIEESKVKDIVRNAPTTGTPPAQMPAPVKLPTIEPKTEFLSKLDKPGQEVYNEIAGSIRDERLESWKDWAKRKSSEGLGALERFASPIRKVPAIKGIPAGAPGTPPKGAPEPSAGPVSVEPGSLDYFTNQEDLAPEPRATPENSGYTPEKTELRVSPLLAMSTLGLGGGLVGATAASVRPLAETKKIIGNYLASRGLKNQKFSKEDHQKLLSALYNNLRGRFESATRVPDPTNIFGTAPKLSIGDLPVVQQKPSLFGGKLKYKADKSVIDAIAQRVTGEKPSSGIRNILERIGLPLPPKTDPSSFSSNQARDLATALSSGLSPAEKTQLKKVLSSKKFIDEPGFNLRLVAGPDPSNSWFNDPAAFGADRARVTLENMQRLFGFSGGSGNTNINVHSNGILAKMYGGSSSKAENLARKLVTEVDDPVKSYKNVQNILRNVSGARIPSVAEQNKVTSENAARTRAAKAPLSGGRKLVGLTIGTGAGAGTGAAVPYLLGDQESYASPAVEVPATKENAIFKINAAIANNPAKSNELREYLKQVSNTPNNKTEEMLNDFPQMLMKIIMGKE